jgi:hypothetical protein
MDADCHQGESRRHVQVSGDGGDPLPARRQRPRRISRFADSQILPGAPLPDALAGALIGRIDNGRPFGIGNLSALLMPASGVLYLGINDDIVSDNSGEFQVVIWW